MLIKNRTVFVVGRNSMVFIYQILKLMMILLGEMVSAIQRFFLETVRQIIRTFVSLCNKRKVCAVHLTAPVFAERITQCEWSKLNI